MNILAMDTCFGACSVAVGPAAQGSAQAFQSAFEVRQTGHAEVLMPMIDVVMSRAGLAFADLQRIAVTTGPGSFTGMRIGIAAARAIGLTLSIPVIGIPTLDVMAHDVWTSSTDQTASGSPTIGPLLIAVDARKNQVYTQLYDANRASVSQPAVLTYFEAAKLAGEQSVTICGNGASLVAAERNRLGLPTAVKFDDLQPSAVPLAMIAAAIDATALAQYPARPFYLRPPDAKPQDGKTLVRAL